MEVLGYNAINEKILGTIERRSALYWGFVFIAFLAVCFGAFSWGYQIATGLGAEGIDHPVMWGTYLVNFVYWVGIAHSGTMISAILYLFRARFRTPLARGAEAMTIFAVLTAGLFPLIHLGRVWLVYWILPYPNQRDLWPNFQSPLVFDVLAISTYLTVSALYWYTGLVPDLAVVRDTASGVRRRIYGILALGWTNAAQQWNHHGVSYLLFAALATPLVISVHSVVSWDFALGIAPGWHSTLFAPYFVAGAIHSGLAMALVLLIPLRSIFHLEAILTHEVFDKVAKTILLTAMIVSYSYLAEFFIAYYGGKVTERGVYLYRAFGGYRLTFWIMTFCNTVVPMLLFFKKVRSNLPLLVVIGILINIGMWLERWVIILSSPGRDYDPYSWGYYWGPTWVEWGIIIGSFGLFFFLFLLFAKFLPSVSIAETKEDEPEPVRAGG